MNVSTGCAFIEFCGIVIWDVLPQKIKSIFIKKAATENDNDDDTTQMTDVPFLTNEATANFETKYRDSILSN